LPDLLLGGAFECVKQFFLEAVGAIIRVAITQRNLAHIKIRATGQLLGNAGGGYLWNQVGVLFRLFCDVPGQVVAGFNDLPRNGAGIVYGSLYDQFLLAAIAAKSQSQEKGDQKQG